jgi:hypothetical protein
MMNFQDTYIRWKNSVNEDYLLKERDAIQGRHTDQGAFYR